MFLHKQQQYTLDKTHIKAERYQMLRNLFVFSDIFPLFIDLRTSRFMRCAIYQHFLFFRNLWICAHRDLCVG